MTRKIVCYVPGCGYQDPDLIRFVEPTSKLLDIACDEDRAVVFKEIRVLYDDAEPSGMGLLEFAGMPIAARVFDEPDEVIECWVELNVADRMWRVHWRGDRDVKRWDYPNLKVAFSRWVDLCGAPYNPMTLGKTYELDEGDSKWTLVPEPAPKPAVAKTPTPRPQTFGAWS